MRDKKAMMGVSTLIIFISAILTSAVAAAVIVRTVGILQERSFTVTTEIRDRLVTALDVVSVSGYADTENQTMWGFDILVRTRSGSYPYSLLTAGLTFITEQTTFTSKLQHTQNEDYGPDDEGVIVTNLTTSSWYSLPDLDKDKRADKMIIQTNADGSNEIIWFEFTQGDTVNFTLGENLDTGGTEQISINDSPIIADSGKWYGFVQLRGDTTSSGAGNVEIAMGQNSSSYFRITHYPEIDWCDFSMLIPEDAYCYETRLGDDDPAVSKGEIYVLRFRLLPTHYMQSDESFEVKLIPKKGDFTELSGQTPDSFTRDMAQIWPTATT